MTSITARNSATTTVTNFKAQALSGLTAASRTTLAAPVATTPPAATSAPTDAVKSTDTSKPQLSFDAVLTLQGTPSAKPAQGTLNSALAAYSANLPKNQELTNSYTVSGATAASSSKLTLADLNGEGASLVNLQTRPPLGSATLSLANQSPQALLKLFS